MEFGKKLKKLRTDQGLSQQKLADMIFMSRSAVAKWENGLGLPSEESYEALAQVFGVPKAFFKTDCPEQVIVEKNKRIKKIAAFVRAAAIIVFCFAWFFLNQQAKNTSAGLSALDNRIEMEFSFSKSKLADYLMEYEYSAPLSEAITQFRMASLYGYYLDGKTGGDPQWLILAEQLREANNPDVFKYLSNDDITEIAQFLEQHEYQNTPQISEEDIAPLIQSIQAALNRYLSE